MINVVMLESWNVINAFRISILVNRFSAINSNTGKRAGYSAFGSVCQVLLGIFSS